MNDDIPKNEPVYVRIGKRFQLGQIIFYVASLGILIVVYYHFKEIKELGSQISSSNFIWLSVALGLNLATYYFTALNFRYVLKMKDFHMEAKSLYPLAFITKFLNQALPSAGLSGQIFYIDYLKRRGFTMVESIGRAILEFTTLYCAFGLLFITAILLLLTGSILDSHPEFKFFVYAFTFIAAPLVIIFFLLQRKRGRLMSLAGAFFKKYISKNFYQEKNNNEKRGIVTIFFEELSSNLKFKALQVSRPYFGLAIACHLVIYLLNVVILYVLALALGFHMTLSVAFIAFTFTQFISMVSFVPGAIGVFEGGMSVILISFGIPTGLAVAVTLLFRGVIFWLPMPIGWWLYKKYTKKEKVPNDSLHVHTESEN